MGVGSDVKRPIREAVQIAEDLTASLFEQRLQPMFDEVRQALAELLLKAAATAFKAGRRR